MKKESAPSKIPLLFLGNGTIVVCWFALVALSSFASLLTMLDMQTGKPVWAHGFVSVSSSIALASFSLYLLAENLWMRVGNRMDKRAETLPESPSPKSDGRPRLWLVR